MKKKSPTKERVEMEMNKRDKNRMNTFFTLCTLSLVFVFVFSAPLSSVPVPSVVPIASAASFSSITITDVTPTTFNPGDTGEVIVTVKNNGGRDARNIRLAFPINPYQFCQWILS